LIRKARSADFPSIRKLLETAFPTPEEADIVELLRRDAAMALELVYEEGNAVLGHVAFSHMTEPTGTVGLAPLAVAPHATGRGIGGKLVRAGLARVRTSGVRGVFVLGEPSYYQRFGFSVARAAAFTSAFPADHMMAVLWDMPASVRIRYAPALEGA